MTTAEIARKMVAYSNGNRHDVNHFMKVWAFAKTRYCRSEVSR